MKLKHQLHPFIVWIQTKEEYEKILLILNAYNYFYGQSVENHNVFPCYLRTIHSDILVVSSSFDAYRHYAKKGVLVLTVKEVLNL